MLHRWLEYFLDDYNKIKHRISHCTKNGEGYQCIKDCVGKWIEKKRTEWTNIKNRLVEQYKSENVYYNVKSSLEKFEDRPEFKKAIKPCKRLEHFQNSKECAVAASSENGVTNKKGYRRMLA